MAWDPSRKLLKFVELRQGGNLEEPAKFDMSQSSLPIPPFHYVVQVELINLLLPSREEIDWERFQVQMSDSARQRVRGSQCCRCSRGNGATSGRSFACI